MARAVLPPQRGQFLPLGTGQAGTLTTVGRRLPHPVTHLRLDQVGVLGDLTDRAVTATAQLHDFGLELRRERTASATRLLLALSMMGILPGAHP